MMSYQLISAGVSCDWEVLTLMADLTPSLQWMQSRTCSDEDFSCIKGSLEVFVATGPQETVEPAEQISRCTQRHSWPPDVLCGLIYQFRGAHALEWCRRDIFRMIGNIRVGGKAVSVARHVVTDPRWQCFRDSSMSSVDPSEPASCGGELRKILAMGKVQWW
jgi:hypothetical protein